jgi:hypothetical protein
MRVRSDDLVLEIVARLIESEAASRNTGITNMIAFPQPAIGWVSCIATAYIHRGQPMVPGRRYGFRIEALPGLMLGAPFRAGATHVVLFGSVAVAYVRDQFVNDAGEVEGRLSRLASET